MSRTLALAAALPLFAGIVSCGGSDTGSDSTDPTVTLWVRASNEAYTKALATKFNAEHETKIKVTAVPNDSFQQKVGAAAGSKSLPDLLASDVVYAPNYTTQGIYADLTDRIDKLPVKDALAPSHIKSGSFDGRKYAVPFTVDVSVLLYNKTLYTKAELDPERPPKTFDEVHAHAKRIRSLGGKTYGFYFAGNCGGCNAYDMFPYAAAAGEPPIDDTGKQAKVDSDALKQTFALHQRMAAEGIAPSSVKNDDGSTWNDLFLAGNIGVFPSGSFLVADLVKQKKFQWGVTPLMAPDGTGQAGFVGGDIIGVSRDSKKLDRAWEFIEWLSGDTAQVEIIAKGGYLPTRTDLAGNKYTAADPRIKTMAEILPKGYTPIALPYGEIFNDANGAWVKTFRGAIFGSDPGKAVADGQQQIQSVLDQAG